MLSANLVYNRDMLFYGKYKYRARLTIPGISRTRYDVYNIFDFVEKTTNPKYSYFKPEKYDLTSIERYLNWRNTYATPLDKSKKQVTLRLESNTVAIFSNDLQLLKTLDSINGPNAVDYTEIDFNIHTGIKYFKTAPKHKYRIYLKSKKVDEKFRSDLVKFFKRYEGTGTVMKPSNSLTTWLESTRQYGFYSSRYCNGHYFFDYDNETTKSLFGLMFGEMIGRIYKLEKCL